MTIFSSLKKSTISFLTGASLLAISVNSYATYTPVSDIITDIESGVTTVSVLIPANNECTKEGISYDDINIVGNFDDCRISVTKDGNEYYLANVIAKFGENLDGSSYEENEYYSDDVNKDMWSFDELINNDDDENISGTWLYSNTFPDIRFWVAKSGSGESDTGFRLFWTIDIDKNDGYCQQGVDGDDGIMYNLNFECMNLAQSVTTGDWTTPGTKGLSHITFFGGLCTYDCNPGSGTQVVPEPSALALLVLGLLGLGARRKKPLK